MKSRLRKRIAKAGGLLASLRIIEKEAKASGALTVHGEQVRGALVFRDGTIIGAWVRPTGERGHEAILTLLNLPHASYAYSKFLDNAVSESQRVEITVSSLIEMLDKLEQSGALLGPNDLRPPSLHPQLDESNEAEQLAKRQKELLSTVKLDDQPFEAATQLQSHLPSLNAQQKTALDGAQREAARSRDAERREFKQLDEYLQGIGLPPTHAELLQMDVSELPRSVSEQQSEFLASEGRLITEDIDRPLNFECHANADIAMQSSDSDTCMDEVFRAQVSALDRIRAEQGLKLQWPVPQPIVRIERQLSRPEPRWVIGTYDETRPDLMGPKELPPTPVTNPRRTGLSQLRAKLQRWFPAAVVHFRPRWSEVMGTACIGCLATAIYVVPPSIKASTVALHNQLVARERLASFMQEDLFGDIIRQCNDLSSKPHDVALPTAQTEAPSAQSSGADTSEPEDLRMARLLVTEGKVEAALAHYEAYLQLDPNSIAVRIELINAYLATKHRRQARLLCIRTLKMQVSNSETSTLWRLLSQCQTDA
jgi:hypothetical protein